MARADQGYRVTELNGGTFVLKKPFADASDVEPPDAVEPPDVRIENGIEVGQHQAIN